MSLSSFSVLKPAVARQPGMQGCWPVGWQSCRHTAPAIFALLVSLLCTVACGGSSQSAINASESENAAEYSDSRLITINEFAYIGAFTLPADEIDGSSMNYANGVMEHASSSLFIVGHDQQNMVTEFAIPELIDSRDIAALNSAGDPLQSFVSVLDRARGGNSQAIDRITGLELIGGSLLINGIEYYDAPADNTNTTLRVASAYDLAGSDIDGYFDMQGAARASGWISAIPLEWQSVLGADYLMGNSSGTPIISRHSVGPSAYVWTSETLLNASAATPLISSRALLEFSLDYPLADDLLNESGENDLWTHVDTAVYGFIVPGTRTYATFGAAGGHQSGIGYKITQDDGTLCPGYCAYAADDVSNYYWFWDMRDLLAVRNGLRAAYSVRPYAYGVFDVPFQTGETFKRIGGASYDAATRTMFVSVLKADNTQGEYANPPVIAAFKVAAPED